MTSIGTAGKQIKKPIDIPRPGKKGKGDRGPRRHPDDTGVQDQQQPLRTPAQPPSRQQQGSTSGSDPYKQGIAVLRKSARPRR